ncbi:tapasin-related protein-like isoform X2 [Mauremys reevesii]|uniref:tapasin-related protein-like isoform X2 n=1 Tax=Mauremys reevesii TaxID=260615 RepID=UPI00193F3065|nr:tapasin-related protein-like isoform X2 [Mauremys reevesii]
MNFRIYSAVYCFLCTGILKHQNGVATAGSTFSQSRQLSCLFETTETIPLLSEFKYLTQNAWLLLSGTERPHQENPPATDTLTFIVQESSLDILQHVDEDTDLLECVFLVRTGPSLIQSGLNKDVLLSCAFSVDHHTDVTIKWVLQQKGGHKKLIFAYNGFTRQVEHKDKRAEMFLAEMPKGNASLLLRTVGVRDVGTYSCSILVSSLLWAQNVQLEIVEKPTVTLNADVLSLVEGDEHKLVCDISHFYPHDAEAQWLQEPMEQGMLPHVVSHVFSSSHRHNSDGTYSFSSYFLLKASLRDDGRRYTCRVEHRSLKHPIKKSLTVKVTESTSATWFLVILLVLLAGCLVVTLYYLYRGMSTNKPKPY